MKNTTEKIISALVFGLLGIFMIFVLFGLLSKYGILGDITNMDMQFVKDENCVITYFDEYGRYIEVDDVSDRGRNKITGEKCDPMMKPQAGLGLYISGGIMLIVVSLLFLAVFINVITHIIGQICLYLIKRDFRILEGSTISQYSIPEVLRYLQKLLFHSRILYYAMKFGRMDSSSDTRKMIKKIYKQESTEVLRNVYDAKNTLNEEIEKIQYSLQNAKNRLESIDINNELLGAKKLQSARLDRQIEQFEELQRVLVKM